MTVFDDTRRWIAKNKLQAVAYIWGGGITASLAYQWTRPIPTQLKIIHSRVYAQVCGHIGSGSQSVHPVAWLSACP
jgi:hypothetical protein